MSSRPPRTAPCVIVTYACSKLPAPASTICLFGAAVLASATTAGLTLFGRESSQVFGGEQAVRHLGCGTGRQAIHMDSVARALEREGLHEAHEPHLCCRVRGLAEVAVEPG